MNFYQTLNNNFKRFQPSLPPVFDPKVLCNCLTTHSYMYLKSFSSSLSVIVGLTLQVLNTRGSAGTFAPAQFREWDF